MRSTTRTSEGHGTTVRVPGRFNGPAASANGGYACGLVAGDRPGPFAVRLQAPPPLERDLELHEDADGVVLRDGETVVARGRPDDDRPDAPPAPALEEVEAAAGAFDVDAYAEHHVYRTCFVCGPARPAGDGLRLFPAPVPGAGLCAWPWRVTDDLAPSGAVDVPVVWAALDCPSLLGVVVLAGLARPAVLGSMTAVLHEPVLAGRTYVVGGWPDGGDGRKVHAGSAVWSADGTLVAAARSTWVLLSDEQVRAFGATAG